MVDSGTVLVLLLGTVSCGPILNRPGLPRPVMTEWHREDNATSATTAPHMNVAEHASPKTYNDLGGTSLRNLLISTLQPGISGRRRGSSAKFITTASKLNKPRGNATVRSASRRLRKGSHPSSSRLLLAVCFAGHVRRIEDLRTRIAGTLHDLGIALKTTPDAFLSIHHDKSVQVNISYFDALDQVRSIEFWHGTGQCPPTEQKCNGWDLWGGYTCTFYFQFEGIRRSFDLMVRHEQSLGVMYDLVMRTRFDIDCQGLRGLAAFRQDFINGHDGGGTQRYHSTELFMGAARNLKRSTNLSILEYDFQDLAWISTRNVANTVMQSVDDYDNCSLMSKTTNGRLCDAAVGNTPRGSAFFECIILVRLKQYHPRSIVMNAAAIKFTCRKLTKDHLTYKRKGHQ